MDLLQLHYFYDSAQNENFSKTAKKYMVPTSSVSASIKRLENELGVELFDRSSNRIRLNNHGQILARELRVAFERIDCAVTEITNKNSKNYKINILIHARRKWITDLIVEYKETHPNIHFQISNNLDVSDFDSFDFIIDEPSEVYKEWDHFLLSTEQICIKASKNSHLANKILSFQQLHEQHFIIPGKGSGMYRILENTCKRYGFTPNIMVECNDRECLLRYVEAGMGLTLGSFHSLTEKTQQNLVALAITDFNETQSVYVYHRKFESTDSVLKSFCDFLYQRSQIY